MRNLFLFGFVLWVIGLIPARAQLQKDSPFATKDPLAQALQQSPVYVGKTLRDRIDGAALKNLTERTPADRPLRIAVVNALPESGKQYGTRGHYTKALHDFLGLGNGTLIVMTRNGVSVATDALSSSEVNQIVQQNASAIQNDPVGGIGQLVNALYSETPTASQPQNSPGAQREPQPDDGFPWVWLIPVGLGVGGVAWLGKKAADKSKALAEARVPVERLRSEVIEGLTYADTYLDLLPESTDAAAARSARQEAAGFYEQAAEFARHTRQPEDYGRAQALLEQAQESLTRARHHIDLATGGTGYAVAVEGTDYKATPLSADGSATSQAAPVASGLRAEDIPANERGACFFCSRPSRISDLTPITIALNGKRRKVLACADDVRIIQQGVTPEIRTAMENGRAVPWYASRSYDPYRDYTSSRAIYAPGYSRYEAADGFWEGYLIGSLFSNPILAPYPVFVTPSGDYTDNLAMNAPDYAVSPDVSTGVDDHTGSADFFGTGGGSDFGNGDTGSADFGGVDAGSADFGGSDSSSFDFGGGDSGGFDAGGSDFGGGGDY